MGILKPRMEVIVLIIYFARYKQYKKYQEMF